MKKNYLFKFGLVLLVLAIDLITKELLFGVDLTLIPFILSSRSTHGYLNTGGAWGVLSENMWLLILITIVFLGLVVFIEIKWKNKNLLYSFALSFIVGGAVGNFIDRIFLGGVRDFLYFEFYPSFPTFNVADSFLCIGVVLMLIFIFFVANKEERKVENIKTKLETNIDKTNYDIVKSLDDKMINENKNDNAGVSENKTNFDIMGVSENKSNDDNVGISGDKTNHEGVGKREIKINNTGINENKNNYESVSISQDKNIFDRENDKEDSHNANTEKEKTSANINNKGDSDLSNKSQELSDTKDKKTYKNGVKQSKSKKKMAKY